MPHSTSDRQEMDTAVQSLVIAARLHGVAADGEQIRHQAGVPERCLDTLELMRSARRLGLKARRVRADWGRLSRLPLPAIARHGDGHFVVIAALRDDRVLIHDPLERRPLALPRKLFESAWSGELILLARRGLLERKVRFGLAWFLPALVKYRRLFGEVLVASFFLQLFALLTPLFFQVVIDKVLVHRGVTTLDVLALGFLLLILFEVTLGGLRAYLLSHTTNRIDVELGGRLFRHLLGLPLAYFQARRVGDSVARVRELDAIRNFLTGSSLALVLDLFFTCLFFVVMWLYSPTLTLITLAAIPFYAVLAAVATPLLRARLREKFDRGAENQAFLVESVSGIEAVKALAVEPQMQRRWEEQLAAYVRAAFRAGWIGTLAGQGATLVNRLTTLAILWVGAHLVMARDLSVGQLVAFNMLAGQVGGPILRLVQLWQEFQQVGISIRRLGDILDTPAEAGVGGGRTRLPRLRGGIRLERVGFRYRPDTPPVLQEIDLEIRPGEVIGIVGRSGSGKSTLARLLQRLHVPEQGRVSIDGVDLALIDPASLRRQIGVVLQENRLFNRSIRDNIALADPAAPMERILEVARLAGADEFIGGLPEGYDTMVEEQGANLSGGQRQRIAIARALLTDPAILILDEATSALDYESEVVIQRNMRAICRGRTVIVIAHRLSAVRRADRILVLDRGRVVEQGSHQQLLSRGGLYARLDACQREVV